MPETIAVIGSQTQASGQEGLRYRIPIWSSSDFASLGLTVVATHVRTLLLAAAKAPQTRFVVGEDFFGDYGCDPAFYAPMFRIRPSNVAVPQHWDVIAPPIPTRGRVRLIIAGSRSFEDAEFLEQRLETLCARWKPEQILGISGGARGADTLGEAWCKRRGIEVARYDAAWERTDAPRATLRTHNGRDFNSAAGRDRNATMAVGATHLVAFSTDTTLTPGTADMVRTAQRMGLAIRVTSPRGKVVAPAHATPA